MVLRVLIQIVNFGAGDPLQDNSLIALMDTLGDVIPPPTTEHVSQLSIPKRSTTKVKGVHRAIVNKDNTKGGKQDDERFDDENQDPNPKKRVGNSHDIRSMFGLAKRRVPDGAPKLEAKGAVEMPMATFFSCCSCCSAMGIYRR